MLTSYEFQHVSKEVEVAVGDSFTVTLCSNPSTGLRWAELANQFLKWAREKGAERVSVTAYAANERAIAFYERLGFEPRNLSLEMGIK